MYFPDVKNGNLFCIRALYAGRNLLKSRQGRAISMASTESGPNALPMRIRLLRTVKPTSPIMNRVPIAVNVVKKRFILVPVWPGLFS